jgi:hypothetical protein
VAKKTTEKNKSYAPKITEVNRPGVHSKKKNSKLKKSKNYVKAYRGQGR